MLVFLVLLIVIVYVFCNFDFQTFLERNTRFSSFSERASYATTCLSLLSPLQALSSLVIWRHLHDSLKAKRCLGSISRQVVTLTNTLLHPLRTGLHASHSTNQPQQLVSQHPCPKAVREPGKGFWREPGSGF